jgi:hypothetical protein
VADSPILGVFTGDPGIDSALSLPPSMVAFSDLSLTLLVVSVTDRFPRLGRFCNIHGTLRWVGPRFDPDMTVTRALVLSCKVFILSSDTVFAVCSTP